MGADCLDTAVALLQGPHGREVKAALLANWDEANGPSIIAQLRSGRPGLPVIVLAEVTSVSVAVDAMRAGARTATSTE